MELFVRIRDANGKPVRERPPKVGEVVEWLREQGAIDYEAAHAVLKKRGLRSPGTMDSGLAHTIVDAALRPPVSSSRENPQ